MSIGQKLTIKIHENDSGAVVFDSAQIVEFNHVAGFTGATTVVKNDITGTPNDAFTVQITTDAGTPFASTLKISDLTTLAVNAVLAEFGNAEIDH